MKCTVSIAFGGMEGERGPSLMKNISQIQFDEEDNINLSTSINLKLCRASCGGTQIKKNGDSCKALNQADSALKKKRRTRRRRVSFEGLEVREYSLTLADHPGTTFGPAIGLSWDADSALKKKRRTRRRRVSFEGLEVREYSLTLADHPGTTFGPAIGLSW
eukprot:CAMPEP_0194442744 /NCGR_PEP_ID=MMETSP0176-20130528/126309_1 /TAXON_ID=216777 /ORGANISM="Proboscia alata, Strain PI-D3" /LENGTH=160 /DNA_ID=CAMNT_0039268893 /DNA_START=172 /DNA_END=651 /DNA_ORIENTATION=-